jgi:hypothetical protein
MEITEEEDGDWYRKMEMEIGGDGESKEKWGV